MQVQGFITPSKADKLLSGVWSSQTMTSPEAHLIYYSTDEVIFTYVSTHVGFVNGEANKRCRRMFALGTAPEANQDSSGGTVV